MNSILPMKTRPKAMTGRRERERDRETEREREREIIFERILKSCSRQSSEDFGETSSQGLFQDRQRNL